MLMAELPLAVLMRWRPATSPWDHARWRPEAVSVDRSDASAAVRAVTHDTRLLRGVMLQLYPDEHDGYFENWAAPEPKVFLLWRVDSDEPAIILASVSYAEGTRMLDSGDLADGIGMPADIHAWLGSYLLRHYEPPARGRRNHG
ncbi:DUF3305 domain-containing protein|uniref:DUF3305 domain-containing protein n=1 Tax=Noviherbaspirillum sp. L7-7A TaxID=2850560 RepID=UPI001C2C1883|nr:DUF3305 domain-containing protein [Noviherbaspirillum sp. L7-7A]MBV0878870.1 DUF3305 domain-containing protein [Noviherbaspirillum sp. L7-7A]